MRDVRISDLGRIPDAFGVCQRKCREETLGASFAVRWVMSAARQILPGSTYMITRRCAQRQFLLAPTKYAAQVFMYCLAVAAERTGMVIHAVTMMSNHYHLIVTDPSGRLPEFTSWFHEFVAKALNARYGRWENFWATEATSHVRLLDAEAVLEKTIYALANPVAAGLVSHGDQWPGVRMFSPGRRCIERPAGFFRTQGPTPEVGTLTLVVPPLGCSSHDGYILIRDELASHEAQVRVQFRNAGRKFLGRAAVVAQNVATTPKTMEPRRGLSPKIACRNKWLRVETLQRCQQFLRGYRRALCAWKQKLKDVVFPAGTYQMVRRYEVPIAPS